MSVLTCPVCQGTMREISRNGVQIDICTQCRGVWLDRGELEKIASDIDERSRKAFLAGYWEDADPKHRRRDDDDHRRRHDDDDRYRDDDDDRRHGSNTRRERRWSFLDFFD